MCERKTHIERHTHRDREREAETEAETERQRQRQRDRDRDRKRVRESFCRPEVMFSQSHTLLNTNIDS